MPIISISINESIKKFINKLISKQHYDNRSKLVRDALLRLMSTVDSEEVDSDGESIPISKKINGNLMIVIPNDYNVVKKINKIETIFKNHIVSRNQHYMQENLTIFMVYEGYLEDFHKLVVEINSISEITNFRYLIIN
ncbi:MAG: putative nickel-responsive regulator [Promethearchaeota archaeon]|nr:MAG: putative nickel-responsive regulator [Candidatus Lokiarchaeota archaeon]